MSYGNTNTSHLRCNCCGHVGRDSSPGIYYMDLFFKYKCKICDGETLLCGDCTGKINSKHTNGEWVSDCKSCVRNRRIDKIVDGKN